MVLFRFVYSLSNSTGAVFFCEACYLKFVPCWKVKYCASHSTYPIVSVDCSATQMTSAHGNCYLIHSHPPHLSAHFHDLKCELLVQSWEGHSSAKSSVIEGLEYRTHLHYAFVP